MDFPTVILSYDAFRRRLTHCNYHVAYKCNKYGSFPNKLNYLTVRISKERKIDKQGGRYTQITSDNDEIVVDIIINEIESDTDETEYIALIIDKTKELEFEQRKFDLISQAEESEKKKIARELHDGLGQQMVLLNLLFQKGNHATYLI